jgi:hypothetical protein
MNRRVAGAAFACGLLTAVYRYLSFTEFSNDHFVHLSTAQQITFGALPVRDFVERGLPLMSMLSAAGQLTLGEGLRTELLVIALGFGCAAALTFIAALHASGSAAVAALAAAVPVLIHPVSYAYPKLLAPSAALVAAGWYSVNATLPRAALLACAIAGAFLLRHDLGVIVGAGVMAAIAARLGFTPASGAAAGRVIAIALLLVTPYLLWVQVYQGIVTYTADGVAFSRREASRANWWEAPSFGIDTTRPFFARLGHGPVINVRWADDASDDRIRGAEARHQLVRLDPNSPRSWQYELRRWSPADLDQLVKDPTIADTQGIDRAIARLQVPAPTGLDAWLVHLYGPGDGLRLRANAMAALFYLAWLSVVAAAIVLAGSWRTSSPEIRATVAMAIAMQLIMNLTMLRDPLETRLRDVFVPATVLVAYLAGRAWQTSSRSRAMWGWRVGVSAMLVLTVSGAASVGEASVRLARTGATDGIDGVRQRLRTIRRTLSPPDQRTGPLAPAYQPVVAYLRKCTRPDARVLMLTFAPELFFYAGRGFAGGQVSLSPGYFSRDTDATLLLQRVSSEDVPLVVMDSQTQEEMLDGYPRIGAFVRSHYHEVTRFPLTPEKAFVVLRRLDAPVCAPYAWRPQASRSMPVRRARMGGLT